jgi:hypothetical protein
MHEPINVKYPNNISKWQMGFNSAFKGLSVDISAAGLLSQHHAMRTVGLLLFAEKRSYLSRGYVQIVFHKFKVF